jgi:hypothetical protein
MTFAWVAAAAFAYVRRAAADRRYHPTHDEQHVTPRRTR